MKNPVLFFCMLLLFACSKEESLDSVGNLSQEEEPIMASRGSLQMSKKEFLELHQHRSFILVCDSKGTILSYRFTDKKEAGLSTLPSREENETNASDSAASCDPLAECSGCMVNVLPNSWNTPEENTYFSVSTEQGGINQYLTSQFSGLNNHLLLPMAPGAEWETTANFEVLYQESPVFAINPEYGDYYNYENLGASIPELDFITPDQAGFLRDEIACEILRTYHDNYPGFLSGAVATGDVTLCNVNPNPSCTSRYIRAWATVGRYVWDWM